VLLFADSPLNVTRPQFENVKINPSDVMATRTLTEMSRFSVCPILAIPVPNSFRKTFLLGLIALAAQLKNREILAPSLVPLPNICPPHLKQKNALILLTGLSADSF
jgi:hypothetical protein